MYSLLLDVCLLARTVNNTHIVSVAREVREDFKIALWWCVKTNVLFIQELVTTMASQKQTTDSNPTLLYVSPLGR